MVEAVENKIENADFFVMLNAAWKRTEQTKMKNKDTVTISRMGKWVGWMYIWAEEIV